MKRWTLILCGLLGCSAGNDPLIGGRWDATGVPALPEAAGALSGWTSIVAGADGSVTTIMAYNRPSDGCLVAVIAAGSFGRVGRRTGEGLLFSYERVDRDGRCPGEITTPIDPTSLSGIVDVHASDDRTMTLAAGTTAVPAGTFERIGQR